jgi:excinuclease ABC subunit C
LVQHIRDEAHRFAVTYHRTLRGRTVSASRLHEIPGVGPRRAQRLLAHFGSVQRLAKATPSEIRVVIRVSEPKAEELLGHLWRPIARGDSR